MRCANPVGKPRVGQESVIPTEAKMCIIQTAAKIRVTPTEAKICVTPTEAKMCIIPTAEKIHVISTAARKHASSRPKQRTVSSSAAQWRDPRISLLLLFVLPSYGVPKTGCPILCGFIAKGGLSSEARPSSSQAPQLPRLAKPTLSSYLMSSTSSSLPILRPR